MTQRALDLFGNDALPGDPEALIRRFREARLGDRKAPSTVAAEVSQLRSLGKGRRGTSGGGARGVA